MKQRTRVLFAIAAVLLAAYLVWRGPSLYRLYQDWPMIDACAKDTQQCP